MGIIKLENISKSYTKEVLKNINIDINEGEFISIVGKSGTGKSTLLNIIGLLEVCDSGNVIIDNEKNIKINSAKSSEVLRNKISYLFQNYALVEYISVYENLILALKYVKLSKNKKRERINEVLKYVGLENYESRKIYELSGGEQQRVAIARVMLKPSKIILADEPTGSLDIENRNNIIKLLRELNKKGKTIIISTHDREIANISDRIIQLGNG